MARKPAKKKFQTTRKRVRKAPAPILGIGSEMPEDAPLEIMAESSPTPDGADVDLSLEGFTIENDDGSIDVSLEEAPHRDEIDEEYRLDHSANLAEALSPGVLGRIGSELVMAIEQDKSDRSEWEQMRSKSVELLGIKIDQQGGNVGGSTASPVPGQSSVRDPLLLEAVLRGQATAYGELCPAAGPVKIVNYGSRSPENEALAESLERDLNYYFTNTASEYYPDTRRMLFWTYLASGTFKKVYRCPIRRRPVAEYVDGTNLIIPGNVTDLKNAGRITHEVRMRPSIMKRMQMIGAYRKVELGQSPPMTNRVEQTVQKVTGTENNPIRPEDDDYHLYESYCELDLDGFEHEEDGEQTGLPLPYIVTIDVYSQEVLAIRRNWKEEDEDHRARIPFVLYPYATGLSIYGIGLGQILGNMESALTALLRLSIDNGIFANFPGFLFSKAAVGRQISNEFRVPPGGGVGLDTGNQPIRDAVMPLPYKEVGPMVAQLIQTMVDRGQKLAGTAEMSIGEGKQEAPVGTTLALIEQATKIEGAVHKALHAAQAEELKLMIALFREDPEALWRGNPRPALGPAKPAMQSMQALPAPGGMGQVSPPMMPMGQPSGIPGQTGMPSMQRGQPQQQQPPPPPLLPEDRVERFMKALENCDLVPESDPNTPSHMDRLMKAMALVQLAQAFPGILNPHAVAPRVLQMLRIDGDDGKEQLIIPPQQPQPPQPDPSVMAGLEFKGKELEFKKTKLISDVKLKEADRVSKENVEVLKLANSAMIHGDQAPKVKDHLEEWGAWVQPGSETVN